MSELFPARHFRELHVNDAQVRVWLPEKADIALRETTGVADEAVAEWIRAFFVAYLYGEHELARMRRTASGLYYVPPQRPDLSRGQCCAGVRLGRQHAVRGRLRGSRGGAAFQCREQGG